MHRFRRTYQFFLTGAFLMLPLLAAAQFEGGSGDGCDRSSTIQVNLNGFPVNDRAMFLGGTGDGADVASARLGLEGSLLSMIYNGGNGDGFDVSNTAVTLDGTSLSALFLGGTGDGFDVSNAAVSLSGTDLSVMFGGGIEDGFALSATTLSLGGFSIAGLYGGGDGDGHDRAQTAASLNGVSLAILYGGGIEDGFALSRTTRTLNGTSLASLYGGGIGDGFDRNATTQVLTEPCALPPSALCRDITVQLDENGIFEISPEDVDNGSFDACGLDTLSLPISVLTCADTAGVTAVLTVVDSDGLTDSCTSAIVVEDPWGGCSCVTQTIALNPGWNMISGFVEPDNPDFNTLISEIESDIILIKDGNGLVVLPGIFNQIGNWQIENGYQVKALNAASLELACKQVDPTVTPISLTSGWNLIAYLRDTPMDANTAWAGISGNILLAKNNAGQVFLPGVFNQIGNLLPGQGYQLKVVSAITLTYPANDRLPGPTTHTPPVIPVHFSLRQNSGNNATIIAPEGSLYGLEPGDEIGVFNRDGQLTGSGVYSGGPMAFAVWGVDATGEDGHQMEDGEDFRFRVFRPGLAREFEARVEIAEGNRFYSKDGITVLGRLESPDLGTALLGDVSLEVYPNPTSGALQINWKGFGSDKVDLEITDAAGRFIQSIPVSLSEEGMAIINLSDQSDGVYLIRVRHDGVILYTDKVILAR